MPFDKANGVDDETSQKDNNEEIFTQVNENETKPRAYSIIVEPATDTDPNTPENATLTKLKDRCLSGISQSSGRRTVATAATSDLLSDGSNNLEMMQKIKELKGRNRRTII